MNKCRLGYPVLLGLIVAQIGLGLHPASAGTIVVNSTQEGVVGNSATCTLQEAIFSANYDESFAIDPQHPTQFVATGCTAGSGDDIIELPQGAVFISHCAGDRSLQLPRPHGDAAYLHDHDN